MNDPEMMFQQVTVSKQTLDRVVAERDRYRAALEKIADPEVHDADFRAMRKAAHRALYPLHEEKP